VSACCQGAVSAASKKMWKRSHGRGRNPVIRLFLGLITQKNSPDFDNTLL
jgi:hypothetical protein